MRILCLSHALPGHLDWGGYLATAAALNRRGHEVLWASGPSVAAAVRAAGVHFASVPTTGWQDRLPPLPSNLSPGERERARRARGLEVWLNAAAVGEALAAFDEVAQAFVPDVVLIEPFVAAGALLIEKMRLPGVVVGRPALPSTAASGPAAESVTRLCQAVGVAGDYWDRARGMPCSLHLHLDFFCRGWYADLTEVGGQTVFCGGAPASIPDSTSARGGDAAPGRPLVLITLGSAFNRDDAFFRIAAGAVLQAGGQPWVVLGREAARPAGLPGEAWVSNWLDFGAVFPRLAAIIHHGGVATTHAALVHGLPQIVVPHAGDQTPQAGRVTQAGVGYGVRPADFDAASAPRLISHVLTDPSFRVSAGWWADEMAALGGAEQAAEAVESCFTRL